MKICHNTGQDLETTIHDGGLKTHIIKLKLKIQGVDLHYFSSWNKRSVIKSKVIYFFLSLSKFIISCHDQQKFKNRQFFQCFGRSFPTFRYLGIQWLFGYYYDRQNKVHFCFPSWPFWGQYAILIKKNALISLIISQIVFLLYSEKQRVLQSAKWEG